MITYDYERHGLQKAESEILEGERIFKKKLLGKGLTPAERILFEDYIAVMKDNLEFAPISLNPDETYKLKTICKELRMITDDPEEHKDRLSSLLQEEIFSAQPQPKLSDDIMDYARRYWHNPNDCPNEVHHLVKNHTLDDLNRRAKEWKAKAAREKDFDKQELYEDKADVYEDAAWYKYTIDYFERTHPGEKF